MRNSLLLLVFGVMALVAILSFRPVLAQGPGVALAPATGGRGPACWVMVGNKVYFVEKDDTTVLKVSASGSF